MSHNSIRVKYLLENQKRGILGEKIAMDDYIENGFKIISTKIGSDFIASKKIGEKLYQEYVEVKTGKSRQSVAQKRKMREMRRQRITYTVYRITDAFLLNYMGADNTQNE